MPMSFLGRDVRIGDDAVVANSILGSHVEVAAGVKLQNCIVDKNVKIPVGECIGYDLTADAARFTVSDKGVVVIPASYRFDETPVPSRQSQAEALVT